MTRKRKCTLIASSAIVLILSFFIFRQKCIPFLDKLIQILFFILFSDSNDRLWDFYTFYNFEIWFLLSICWMLFCIYLIYSYYLFQMAVIHTLLLKGNEFVLPKYCIHEVYEIKEQLNKVDEEIQALEQITIDNQKHKNDMIVYLAHDLKTPLTSIIGYLHLLQDQQVLKKEEDFVYRNIIKDKLNRLETLRSEIAQVIETESNQSVMESIDVNVLLRSLIVDFTPIIKKSNLKLTYHDTKDCMVNANKEKMIRVFSNLIKNAVNYTQNEHRIEIVLVKEENWIIVKVLNDAADISDEMISHLFEKFYRGEYARTSNTGGAGLGLAIAKDIVLQHEGTIAANYQDQQFQIEVKLPRHKGEYYA